MVSYSLLAQNDLQKSLEKREAEIQRSNKTDSLVSAYKPNYILPATYMHKTNTKPFSEGDNIDNVETKYQLSFRFTVLTELLGSKTDLDFAYTQKSFWQLYNKKSSAVFRETNYEPELFLTFKPFKEDWRIFKNYYQFGFLHQSNGKDLPQSRSWNRIFLTTYFEWRETLFMLKLWYRLPENNKTSPSDYTGDDNPDLTDYTGFFELTGIHKIGGHTLTMVLRNNLKKDNKGSIELDWSFPLPDTRLKGYLQYYNGYAESLIDYNFPMSRVGLGVAFTDWL